MNISDVVSIDIDTVNLPVSVSHSIIRLEQLSPSYGNTERL
jgi:hypothetical protein